MPLCAQKALGFDLGGPPSATELELIYFNHHYITMSDDPLSLNVLPTTFSVVKFSPEEGVPASILAQLSASTEASYVSVARTKDEISIVTDAYPSDAGGSPSHWRCIRVTGPLPHYLTGILNDISTPLKQAKVPIFSLSTWDTDYVLVPIHKVGQAVSALEEAGWRFAQK